MLRPGCGNCLASEPKRLVHVGIENMDDNNIQFEEGSQLSTKCRQLKMKAQDGKKRLTDVANTEQLLRIIQLKSLSISDQRR